MVKVVWENYMITPAPVVNGYSKDYLVDVFVRIGEGKGSRQELIRIRSDSQYFGPINRLLDETCKYIGENL